MDVRPTSTGSAVSVRSSPTLGECSTTTSPIATVTQLTFVWRSAAAQVAMSILCRSKPTSCTDDTCSTMRTQELLRGIVLLSRRTSSMVLPATRLDRLPMLTCLHGSVEGCRDWIARPGDP